MGEPKSRLEKNRVVVEKRNTIVTCVALLIWLGLSLLGQALFMGQNERLDAGAIFLSGGGMPPAVMSGRHTIKIICKKDKKKFVTTTP